MRTLTRLSVAFAVLGVLLLVFGTAGFSAMSADRGVDVSVVDDDDAYVGIETVGDDVYDGDRITLLTVTNQFATDVEGLDVEVVDGSDAIGDETVKPEATSLGVGQRTDVTAECTMEDREGSVELEITGEAGGASFDIVREVEVDCSPTTGEEEIELEDVETIDGDTGNLTVRFTGVGNVFISGDSGNYSVELTYRTGQNEQTDSKEVSLPESDGQLRDGGGQVVEVTVGNRTVTNPIWG